MKLLIIFILLYSSVLMANELRFEKAWVRAVPKVSRVSAGFGTIVNDSNRDRMLIKAESPISKVVELHTHKKKKGVMKMRPVEFIKIPKNSSKKLKRMSYHIMFIELVKPLEIGQKVPIKLIFDNGQTIDQLVEVKKM